MGIAALVLGIISVILGIIPFCGVFGFIPAVVGLGLAIGDLVSKAESEVPKGLGIAGLVLNILALIFITLWIFLLTV